MTDTAGSAIVNINPAFHTLTIDGSLLHVADPAAVIPASGIIYTITALPQFGTLAVDGTTLALNGQFTQQQIDDGLVVYSQPSTNLTFDTFGFSISDASNDNFGTGSFHIGESTDDLSADASIRIIAAGTSPVILFSGPGSGSFTGGTDTTVSYADAPAGATIVLSGGPTNNGFRGADTLVNINSVIGSSFNDVFFAGPGSEFLVGGGGNDKIIGNPNGNDTVGFSGALSDYLVVSVNAVEVKITDLRPGSPDGTDDVVWAQSFKFSDGTYTLAQLNPIDEIDQSGATAVALIGNNYFLYATGTASGPELKYQGSPVPTSGFGGWFAIGAEQVAGGGYDVAWQNSDGTYTVWAADSNGNYVSNLVGKVSATDPGLEALETTFQQDLNHDGVVGAAVPFTTIEAYGVTRLAQVGSNYFLYANGTTNGPELKYQGSPVVSGGFAGWTVIAAEQAGSGYDVAWHNSNGTYTVWSVDANGNYVSNLVGAVSGFDDGLQSLEWNFQQDINGDGYIGLPAFTQIEAFGATSLIEIGNNYFLYANGTTSGPELKYQGSPVTNGGFAGWTVIATEQVGSGYDVAWHNSNGTYTVWSVDANGNYLSNVIGAVTASDTGLMLLENTFHQDLNGDFKIGIPAIESFGSTSLTQIGNNYFLYANGTANGPELKYQGSPVVSGGFAGWTVIGAEQVAGGGYDVAWHNSNGTYTVWSVDANGNYLSNLIGAVTASDSGLQSLETTFHQDLNGDGSIGPASQSSSVTVTMSTMMMAMPSMEVALTVTPVPPITAPASGNAVLQGTAAADTFVFNAHFGNDTVAGFQPGVDHVNLDHTLAASIADLFNHTTDNAAGSAVVTIAADQSIAFDGVSKLVLQQHASDFHLI